jgi:anti-sigma factor RsiW
MKCSEYRELALELALGELPEARRQDVEGHLASCLVCRGEFQRLQHVCRALEEDAYGDGLSELERARLEGAVYRRLAARAPSGPDFRGRFALAFVRVAAALALFALGYAAHSYFAGHESPGDVTRAEQAYLPMSRFDRDLSGGLRFSAAGLKVLAEGRRAAAARLERTALQQSEIR